MTGEGNSKRFAIGELVESVFDKGTVYRVVKLHPPQHHTEYSTYLSLELVSRGPEDDDSRLSPALAKGRMGDGRSYAPYHFNEVRP